MALERVTMVDKIDLDPVGDMHIRLMLMVVDGDNVVAHRYHRTTVAAGVSVADQFALVNTHLASMGELPVSAADIARVVGVRACDNDLPGRKADAVRLLRKPIGGRP